MRAVGETVRMETRPTVRSVEPPSYRHVLVPLDGSRLSEAALPVAEALAARFGAELVAVSVAAPLYVEETRELASARLDDAWKERLRVVEGHEVAPAIATLADELGDTLLCLSSHGRGRVGGAVIGSIAREILETTGAPVVAVGHGVQERFVDGDVRLFGIGRLVACVDGGPDSEQVLPHAAGWASALGLRLSVITVAEPIPPPMREDKPWHRHHGPDRDADRYIEELRERWKPVAPDLTATAVYDPIGPGRGLEAHLEGNPADLVAVTTHARSGLERVLLGAGAANIIQHSPVPVLVVPLEG